MYCYNCMSEIKDGSFCTNCMSENKVDNAPHHLKPGTILNKKYIIGNVIGEGGFGITYIGLDTTLDIKVAIKEYYPSGYVNRNHDSTNEITITTEKNKNFFDKGKESFLVEARNIAKFNRESGIVDVRDYFEENETAYIIMEYLDGQNLGEYIKKNGNIDAKEMFTLMLPIMESLKKMHSAGIIHRDISPDNLMYMKDGSLMLMDFGSARYFNNQEKMLSVLLKVGYSPEEQYRKNGNQGPWTDVYGMCATMYRCITGKVPEDALDRLHVDNIKTPSQLGIEISKPLEATLMYGLAVHKENRCQDMAELIADTKKAIEKNKTPNKTKFVSNDDIYKTQAADQQYKTQMADVLYENKSQEQNLNNLQPSYNNSQKESKTGTIVALVLTIVIVVLSVCMLSFYLFSNIRDVSENEEENTVATEVTTEATTEPTTEVPTEPTTEEPKYNVPNVVSLSEESAKKAIEKAGFKAAVEHTDSATVDYGYVVNQSPVSSAQAKKGETVTIYISKTQQLDPQRTLYVNANETVNFRESPSRSSDSLGELKYNTPVEIISTSGDFSYVEYHGKTGYILSEFLSYNKNPEKNYGDGNEPTEDPKYRSSSTTLYYCCASDYATLRQSPSRDSNELSKIYCREAVEYIGSKDEFYYVEFNGQKGYVLKDYFSRDIDAPLNYGDS